MHTTTCDKDHLRWQQFKQDYEAKWPHHCKTCKGWGGSYYDYDPSPSGISLAPGYMTDFDPCPDCYERGVCPRCAGKLPPFEELGRNGDVRALDLEIDEAKVCPHCGWTSDDLDGVPEQLDCDCYLLAVRYENH